MNKDAYWFPHDSNAREDKKMKRLRRLRGYEGVGIFWCVVEMLREENAAGYKLELSSIEDIAFQNFDESVFDDFFDIGLLDKDDEFFWSDSLVRRMRPFDEKRRKLSAAGKRGGRPLKKGGFNQDKGRIKGGKREAKARPKPAESKERRGEERIGEDNNPPIVPPKGTGNGSKYTENFEQFWTQYPKHRRKAKQTAFKAWERARKNGMPSFDAVMFALAAQKASSEWKKDNGQYIPLPATWINGARWDDEIDDRPPEPPNSHGGQRQPMTAQDRKEQKTLQGVQAFLERRNADGQR